MSIAIVFGGPSEEHDISVLTALQAASVLEKAGTPPLLIYWSRNERFQLLSGRPDKEHFCPPTEPPADSDLELVIGSGFRVKRRFQRPLLREIELVINCCHGGPGEDGSLAALLALSNIKVSGPSPASSGLAMDKLSSNSIAEMLAIPSIPTVLWGPNMADPFPGQWVVKPRFGGSSIGVQRGVEDLKTVETLASVGISRAGVLIQPFLDGWSDLNVAVRRIGGDLVCSAIERPKLRPGEIWSYEDKYLRGAKASGDHGSEEPANGREGMASAAREVPAKIDEVVAVRVRDYAQRLYAAMGMTGVPRFDFMWDGDQGLYFNEVNPIPGSLGYYLWASVGVTYEELLTDLLKETRASDGVPYQWRGTSDGVALRHGSIALKLRAGTH